MGTFRTCPDCGRLMLSDAQGNFPGCACTTDEET